MLEGASEEQAAEEHLGEQGPSLTVLDLPVNAITSLPTEPGDLTGLRILGLGDNAITSLPSNIKALTSLEAQGQNNNKLPGVFTKFQTVNPSVFSFLSDYPSFSCANVNTGTTCCNTACNVCGKSLIGGQSDNGKHPL